jgi:hypothetical protein
MFDTFYRSYGRIVFLLALLIALSPAASAQEPVSSFEVLLPPSEAESSLQGRMLLFLASSPEPEPRFGPSIFDPAPVFAVDLAGETGTSAVIFRPGQFESPTARAFPQPLGEVPSGTYYVQALLDRDSTRRSYAEGPGNLYSSVQQISFDPDANEPLEITLDHTVPADPPEPTDWVKFMEIRSELLSDFHGKETHLRAGVILPPGYAENPQRQYPVVYVIPGFGGRHTDAWEWMNGPAGEEWKRGDWPMPMIRVVLDPDTPLGHSTFANSANNGPVGDALVEELIPSIETRFRTVAAPHGRFLRGHSSGGWASLWLQIEYPEFFGGAWSTAPDPVDFHAFQVVDIYEDENAYWTEDGYPTPSIRSNGEIVLSIRDENRMEYVTGPGGQWGSWHAVFGPRGDDRKPVPLWNELSGRINQEVADDWKQYDIRRKLEEHWSSLAPKLRGKLHVVGATEDNFYLNRALVRLKAFLDTTDYDGYIELRPGDHGSFLNAELRRRFYSEMKQTYRSHE